MPRRRPGRAEAELENDALPATAGNTPLPQKAHTALGIGVYFRILRSAACGLVADLVQSRPYPRRLRHPGVWAARTGHGILSEVDRPKVQ
jgi:hypothetical protein